MNFELKAGAYTIKVEDSFPYQLVFIIEIIELVMFYSADHSCMFYLRLRDEASINRLPGLRFIADRGPANKCKIFLSLTDSAIVGLLTLSLRAATFVIADHIYKQFRPRYGPTEGRSLSGSKPFDTLIVFM